MRIRLRFSILLLVSVGAAYAWFLPFSDTQAFPVFPAGFIHETLISEGLDLPTAMAFGPNGSLFIAEKRGVVRVWQDGALLPEPFIDLSDEVNQSGDRGLLGLALHPNFPATPYVYLLYVYDPPGAPLDGDGARVARLLRVTADDANPMKASTERVVLLGKNSTLANSGNLNSPEDQANVACQNTNGYVADCLPDDFPAHTIGTVAFGPDGKLYVGNGDGGSWKGVDPRTLRVQSLNSLAGKLLRIDPLTGAGLADNPFYDGNPQSNASKVFNYGLRSPFRFTFHPTTGEPFIGDVGWGTWEEINVGRGKNFGWPCYEGGFGGDGGANERQELYADNPRTSGPCQQLYAAEGTDAAVTPPLHGYGRDVNGASLTMGVFYTGQAWPAGYRGALFFGDYNNNWIKYLTFDPQGRPKVNDFSSDDFPISGPVQLLMGPDEQLYYIGLGEVHGVYRVRYTGNANQPPVAKVSADVLQGVPPLTVNFSSVGSLAPEGQPLNFAWTFGDGTSSTEANPRKVFEQSGNYLVRLTVTDAEGLTHSDTLEIVVGNTRPLLTLQAPTVATRFMRRAMSYVSARRPAMPKKAICQRAFSGKRCCITANTRISTS